MRLRNYGDISEIHRVPNPISNPMLPLIVTFLPQDPFLKPRYSLKLLPSHTLVTLRGCDWERQHNHHDENKNY